MKEKIQTELNELEILISELNKKLKPLIGKKKKLQDELIQIEKDEKIAAGASPELIELQNLRIFMNEDDYMSWSISDRGLEIFESYVDQDYWNRYQTYNFIDELDEALIKKDWDENKLDVREDIISSLINLELTSFDCLTKDEIKVVNDYIIVCKGITSNNFKFDW